MSKDFPLTRHSRRCSSMDGDSCDCTPVLDGDDKRIAELEAEVARLQKIIDGRPAINAGLPETYIKWSQSIYTMEAVHALGLDRN